MLFVGLIAYFAVRIVVMIIAHIVKKIVGDREISGFSRFIGGILSAVNGVLISVILIVTALTVAPIKGVGDAVTPITDSSVILNSALPTISKTVDDAIVSDDTILKAIEYAGYTFME